ncbi:10132_t:CDS:1, partial [Dentiscutata heterogama]
QIDNLVDNVGITESADWNSFNITNSSLFSALPLFNILYHPDNLS